MPVSEAGTPRGGDAFRLRDGDVVWREVDDEIVILDASTGTYLSLEGSACLLWKALEQPMTAEDLASLLVRSFGISGERADADARTFLADLEQRSLVETAS